MSDCNSSLAVLQFLVRALQFLVRALQLFVGRFQLLVRRLQFLDRGLQILLHEPQFPPEFVRRLLVFRLARRRGAPPRTARFDRSVSSNTTIMSPCRAGLLLDRFDRQVQKQVAAVEGNAETPVRDLLLVQGGLPDGRAQFRLEPGPGHLQDIDAGLSLRRLQEPARPPVNVDDIAPLVDNDAGGRVGLAEDGLDQLQGAEFLRLSRIARFGVGCACPFERTGQGAQVERRNGPRCRPGGGGRFAIFCRRP